MSRRVQHTNPGLAKTSRFRARFYSETRRGGHGNVDLIQDSIQYNFLNPTQFLNPVESMNPTKTSRFLTSKKTQKLLGLSDASRPCALGLMPQTVTKSGRRTVSCRIERQCQILLDSSSLNSFVFTKFMQVNTTGSLGKNI